LSEEKKPQSTSENTSPEISENTSPEISENTSPETKHDSIDNNSNIQSQTITIKKSTYSNMIKGAVVAIAIAAFFGGYLTGTMDGSITNQNLLDAIEEIEITQAAPQAAPQPAQAAAPSTPQLIRVSLDDDPIKGDPDAPVTIVEFSDFQCPFCARFFQQTLPLIEENYIETGKVKLVYRDLPLASIHPNAIPSHIAAECADDQGKFWEYLDILFENQSLWNRLGLDELKNIFKQYADDLELDAVSYDSCLDSSYIVDEINDDLVAARALGATGTPTFFIGTEKDGYTKITGAQPFAVFQKNIEDLLS
jgi:protein-disulfide isomerase